MFELVEELERVAFTIGSYEGDLVMHVATKMRAALDAEKSERKALADHWES